MASINLGPHQTPDLGILDLNGRQLYLGNSFIAGTKSGSIGSTSETTYFLMNNPSSSKASMVVFVKKMEVLVTTSAIATFRYYNNPTIAAASVQTVHFVADSGGSLNSTYFLLNDAQGNGYYVWFNINSAGVDPAIAGRTGIQVAGATNANGTTLAQAAKPLIAAINSAASFSVSGGGATLTITCLVNGPTQPMVDGAAATGFTFAVTAGPGSPITPVNLRLNANSPTSKMVMTQAPVASANGVFVADLGVTSGGPPTISQVAHIIDPGNSILVTVTPSSSSAPVAYEVCWFELPYSTQVI
jgi:hypothetical protein